MPFDVQILSPTQAWKRGEYFKTETLETRLPPKYLAGSKPLRLINELPLCATWASGAIGVVLAGLSLTSLARPRPTVPTLAIFVRTSIFVRSGY